MKRHHMMVLAGAMAMLIGCSDEPPPAATTTAREPASTEATASAAPKATPEPSTAGSTTPVREPAPAATADSGTAAATAPAQPLSQKGSPAITQVDSGKVYDVETLYGSQFHWIGERVRVAGHPALFMERGRWNKRMLLGAEPKAKTEAVVECRFDAPPREGNLTPDVVITVDGTVSTLRHNDREDVHYVALTDCVLVSTEEPLPAASDPFNLDGSTILARDLRDAMASFLGKVATVQGYFKSNGYSSATDQTRFNLRTDRRAKTRLACFTDGKVETPEEVLANRESARATGTIRYTSGTVAVEMDDCSITAS